MGGGGREKVKWKGKSERIGLGDKREITEWREE